jgi:UDP-glucuronate decarboxylase
MHLLVTGGTGFFGKALLRHWAAVDYQGLRVTVVSREPDRFRKAHADLTGHPALVFHEGDVTRPETLPRKGDFTHVIHAATESTAGPLLTPMQRYDHCVEGTRNVLDVAVRLGVRRLLLTSSGGVYGPFPPGLDAVPESYRGLPDPLNAENAYSLAKIASEHLCALYSEAHPIEPVIARCFAFSGEDLPLDAHFAIGNFVRDAARGRRIVVHGDGSPVRSYLDQRDLAHWLMTLVTRGQPMRAYNVGSDQAISIAELAGIVAGLGGTGEEPLIEGREDPNPVRNRYVPDITRARDELGLDVTTSLDESLRGMLRAAR